MKLLLDTHIFIWWADQPEKLSPAALSALEDEANELLLSVASVWEMQIKIQLGKLKLSLPLKELVKNQQESNDFMVSRGLDEVQSWNVRYHPMSWLVAIVDV